MLTGVLSLMLVIGWLLYVLQTSFGTVLPWLLPIIYLVVGAMGILMHSGRTHYIFSPIAYESCLEGWEPSSITVNPTSRMRSVTSVRT